MSKLDKILKYPGTMIRKLLRTYKIDFLKKTIEMEPPPADIFFYKQTLKRWRKGSFSSAASNLSASVNRSSIFRTFLAREKEERRWRWRREVKHVGE